MDKLLPCLLVVPWLAACDPSPTEAATSAKPEPTAKSDRKTADAPPNAPTPKSDSKTADAPPNDPTPKSDSKAADASANDATAKSDSKADAEADSKEADPTKADSPPTDAAPAKPPASATSIPATRPKSLPEAKTFLVAVAAGGDIGALHRLVEAPGWLEVSYQHENARRRRTKVRTDDAATFAAAFSGEPWQPVHYTSSLTDDFASEEELQAALHLDEGKSTITYEPDAQFTVAFVFAKKAGGALSLVRLELADEAP